MAKWESFIIITCNNPGWVFQDCWIKWQTEWRIWTGLYRARLTVYFSVALLISCVQVWPGLTAFPDFTYSRTQVYWEKMLSQFRDLVEYDGLWIDMNEPSNELDGSTKGCPTNSPLDHPPYTPHVSGGVLYSRTLCMSAKHHDYSHYDVHSLYGLTEMENTMR